MKITNFFIVLLAFVGLALVSCSDESQSPVTPIDQVSLEKVTITDFTFTDAPIGLTVELEIKLVVGNCIIKDYGVIEEFVSPDPLVSGTMVHYLSLTIDAVTGEGPCHGSWTVTPTGNTGGGVWEGTYEGYRSLSTVPGEWTLPLNVVGHGRGGTIDGFKMSATATLTIYTNGITTLPSYWTGIGYGFYKSHED
jgi:hypothetical protein